MPRTRPRPALLAPLLALTSLLALPALAGRAAAAPAPQTDEEIEALVAAERAEARALRLAGDLRGALALLDVHLEDDPGDHASRLERALCHRDATRWEDARRDAARALEDARAAGAPRGAVAACVRALAGLDLELGRSAEALARLRGAGDVLDADSDARDAWLLGRALANTGAAEEARAVLDAASRTPDGQPWEALVARARCEQWMGRLQRASQTLVLADRAAREATGREQPDVLAALADLYFESEREIDVPGKRSAGQLYKEAEKLDPTHEGALLGLFQLHRYNRQRTSRSPEEILATLLAARPRSVEGWLADATADLEDGQLPRVRRRLAELQDLAPGRREVRTLAAALAWVEHRRDECEELLLALVEEAPADSRPEREVGRLLLELYRFREALPFLERAVARDREDHRAWTHLAHAYANTGDEDRSRLAFQKAELHARGRRDAWRENMTLVLERMEREHVVEDFGELSFSWQPDAADVLRVYLPSFYEEARLELAERYGFTPEPTRVLVFRRHADFSVRSVGYQGFPALGVCFGPVVTALSPLSEMRGTFSWARTSFHEFSHVVHLGLSNNRCPRWITEGLATWEEEQRNPSWSRNMRRDLVDAFHNDDLIPLRDLNRAFRTSRILFGYYQGGLLCRMLIDRHGFPPMIRLLEAFDRGLDLDRAFAEVFDTTPEEVDERFHAFVADIVADLRVEPRWHPTHLRRLQLRLPRECPAGGPEREAWIDGWTTLAFGAWQQRRTIDAEEALRRLAAVGDLSGRALCLQGEMALSGERPGEARRLLRAGLEAGHVDFRALVALGNLEAVAGEHAEAEGLFRRAEEAFPGYPDASLAAELRLVNLYSALGDEDAAMEARERWLEHDAGALEPRRVVAAWHAEHGRHDRALVRLREANEIDPFLRQLHVAWADSAAAAGLWEEALREYEVAALVPLELDADRPGALTDGERARLLAGEARCLLELERLEEARERARRARALDGAVDLPAPLADQ